MIDDDLTVLRPQGRVPATLEPDGREAHDGRTTASHDGSIARHVVVSDVERGATWPVGDGLWVGRSPVAPADAPPAGRGLVVVASPSGSVSGTHLRLRTLRGRVLARDLRSRNGTRVLPVVGAPYHLGPGEELPLPVGTRLDLGDGVLVTVLDPQEVPARGA